MASLNAWDHFLNRNFGHDYPNFRTRYARMVFALHIYWPRDQKQNMLILLLVPLKELF